MCNEKKRARRRRDRARMIAKAIRVYPGDTRPQRIADNLKHCSCPMCGNPRRWGSGPGMQERQQAIRDRDWACGEWSLV